MDEDLKIQIAIRILNDIFSIRDQNFKEFNLILDSGFDKGFCLETMNTRIYFVKNIDVKIIKHYTKLHEGNVVIVYIESKTDCQYEDENVEIFSLSQLQYNIFENHLMSSYEKCDDVWYKGKYPKILASDISCKILGVKSGFIKIIRNDGNGSYMYIREIV
jgi:hypothetical protein